MIYAYHLQRWSVIPVGILIEPILFHDQASRLYG